MPQPPDRRLHRRRPHVRALHDHVGGEGGAGERLLHPLVRLHRRERLRERLRARLDHAELERGQRERDQEPAREDGGQERPAEDAAHDRTPDPTLAVVAAKPADERNPAPVDPVAEPRQQRRQHGQRPDHRHRDNRDRGDREGLEDRVTGEEHPGHRRHHGQAGDEHGAARGRGCGLQRGPLAAARRSLFAFSLQVEERVVDADREPDQEHERTCLVRHREDVAGAGDDAEGGEDGRQGEQQRDACGDESAERDHEDDERDREREHPGLAQILRDGGGDRVDGAGHAELADVELRMRLLGGLDLGEDRVDLLRRLVGRAADLELDESRAAVGGNLPAADVLDDVELREPRHDVFDGGCERGIARRERTALDEDALLGRPVEARVEDPIHAAGLARAGRVRVDRLRPGHPEREGGDDEGEPAEGRGLPVIGAPASHPRREIVVRGA